MFYFSIFTMGLFVFFICLIIVSIIAQFKLFQKAGEKGWKSLIPIYSEVIFCKCFMGKPELAAIPFACSFFTEIFSKTGDSVLGLLSIPISIISIVYYVNRGICLGKSFGKSGGFIWGLILLPFIFELILAFGDDQYYGPKGVSMYSYNDNNNGYGDTSYIGVSGYQNNGYNINNAYQNTGYNNTGYNNNNGYQNGGYNNTAYNKNTYQNSGYGNNNGYQNGAYNNNAQYQNGRYNGNNQYQNNNGTMDDVDISNINTDDLDN